MRIFIVEDEKLSRDHLKKIILKLYNNAIIICESHSVKDTIEKLKNNSFDLIFMDIQLSDGLCFEIFEHIEINKPIIFTTAFDQYAIKSFQENGIGYILKPVNKTNVKKAIEKYHKLFYPNLSLENLKKLIIYNNEKTYRNRISINSGNKISFIKINEIAYFYSDDNSTFAVNINGDRKLIDQSLSVLENQLNPNLFYRITRNCITHINSIDTISKYFNSRLKIKLKPIFKKELLISRVNVPDFKRWLDENF